MPYLFGVRDAKIARWTAADTWGTLYDLPAVNRVEYNPAFVSGQLEGDDVEVDSFSKMIAVEGRVVFGDNPIIRPELYSIIVGSTNTSSGSKVRIEMGSEYPYYFGLAWKVVQTDNSAEDHFLIKKCRITNMQVAAAYGGYVVPELSFRGVADADENITEFVQGQALDTALAMPLTF